jgi:uncharacterized protein (TIGR03067 family)
MLVAWLLILSSGIASPVPPDPAGKVREEMQGTWVATALEQNGVKLTAKEVEEEEVSITVKGNELTLLQHGSSLHRFSFTLDLSKATPHIDLKVAGDGVVHAIYSLENGVLRLCFGSNFKPDETEARPRGFATGDSPPKGKIMLTLKKATK